jgi:hypothetical protein
MFGDFLVRGLQQPRKMRNPTLPVGAVYVSIVTAHNSYLSLTFASLDQLSLFAGKEVL